MAITALKHLSEQQNRALQRIVTTLTSAEARKGSTYKHARQHDRKGFQGPVLICIPSTMHPEPGEDHPSLSHAWAYDISAGGIGLLSLENILTENVCIGLKRPDGTIRWMSGRIVRSRPIPEEAFYDYGVSFRTAAAAAS